MFFGLEELFPSLVTAIYVINFFIACTIIFLERKDPSATLAWIAILMLVPIVGVVFYLMFAQNIARKKLFRLKSTEEDVISKSLNNQINEMEADLYTFKHHTMKKWQHMIRLHQIHGKGFFTQDNKVSIFTDGKEKFDALFEDIRNAKVSVNIQYYIVKNDALGRELIHLLTQKASEGVEVRFLMDALGCRQIFARHLKEFEEAGGKYAVFFPPKFKFFNMKLNYRNHRKIVIIDNKVGYLGGFNVGNEYIGKKKKFGYWRDTHLRIQGSSIQDLQARFILDWRFASKEDIMLPLASFDDSVTDGTTGIQIVASGPDSTREEIKHGYLKMISTAQKDIYIQTPYFVPDYSILEALRTAALSGINVNIMIPCMPDHMFVYWATYSYIGDLLRVGAKCYIYTNGFLHAKTICVDGEVASIGSANFDIRSFRLNFEANAFIYDAEVAKKLEEIFQLDITNSYELTRETYKSRSTIIKFKESISRLLSSLL